MSNLNITLPEGWDEISIGQFNKMNELASKKLNENEYIVKLIELFNPDIDKELLTKIFVNELSSITSNLVWMGTLPSGDVRDEFKIGDDTYRYQRELNKLTVGEMVSYEVLLDNPNISQFENNSILLSIILRKVMDDGTLEEFNSDIIMERKELFENELTINETYGLVFFFLNGDNQPITDLEDCLKETERIAMDLMNLYQMNKMEIPSELKTILSGINGNG